MKISPQANFRARHLPSSKPAISKAPSNPSTLPSDQVTFSSGASQSDSIGQTLKSGITKSLPYLGAALGAAAGATLGAIGGAIGGAAAGIGGIALGTAAGVGAFSLGLMKVGEESPILALGLLVVGAPILGTVALTTGAAGFAAGVALGAAGGLVGGALAGAGGAVIGAGVGAGVQSALNSPYTEKPNY
jgi:hypothetical protein